MSSRNILNLILLVVIAVLVAVVIYEPGKEAKPEIKVTGLQRTTISKISVTRIGSKPIVLEKKDNKWQMLEPYHMPANEAETESLTELATAPSLAQFPVKEQELKPYGLDTPRVSVTFNDKEKLEFGGTEPLKHLRYVRYNDTLHVITDRFYYNLSRPATDFVDHALLPGKPTITKLVLPKLTLTSAEEKWQAQPAIKDLSRDQVNELLDNWKAANATELLEYKPVAVKEQVQLYHKDSDKPLVFDVIREEHAISLGRADLGLQYKFTEEIGKGLLQLPPKIQAEMPTVDKPEDAKK